MIKFFKNLVIIFIIGSFVLQPFAILMPEKARATTEDTAVDEDSTGALEEDNDDSLNEEKGSNAENIGRISEQAFPSESSSGYMQMGSSLDYLNNPHLIFNTTDLAAIRSLYCLVDIMPDFYTDFDAMYNYLPTNLRPASVEDLKKIKITNFDQFQDLYYQAQKAWAASPGAKDPKAVLEQEKQALVNASYSTNADPQMMSATSEGTEGFKTLRCIIGGEYDIQELFNIAKMDPYEMNGAWHSGYLDSLVNTALESTTIDIRIIKMLDYLVMPKNMGGAGHWRVRVKKLLQDTARPYSNESETIRLSLGTKETANTTVANCAGMTAADCGVAQGENEDGDEANITAEDENGDEYDAYLESLDNAENEGLSIVNTPERNVSLHTKGQAVDIMELDDIRCTLTIVKKRRIGGNKTSHEKKVLRPVKFAWQSSQSYDQSGGNTVDMMSIMKDIANDEMMSLVEELNGDVTDYSGDLSNANFSDIVGIVGKTIFSQLLNSPNHDFAGYDSEDTLQKLGAMYFADYLGLPREIFIGRNINTLEDLEIVIGEAALEKRANLPFGSLDAFNYTKSTEGGSVYDLEGTLINAGKRKLEYEMNLNPGDLINYNEGTASSLSTIIGSRVIEKGLNIPKDSFRGDDFRGLKKSLGDVRAALIFSDPTHIDNLLHVTPGTTKQLMNGTISPAKYAETVGDTRKNDTINGFKYLSANNAAYNLPDGAWNEALLGKASGFMTIGRFAISRVIQQNLTFSKYLYSKGGGHISEEDYLAMKDLDLTADPDDIGAAAAQKWLLDSLSKTDKASCKIPDNIKTTVPVKITNDQTKAEEIRNFDVDINEDNAISLGLLTGDLYRMFGCASASPHSVFARVGSKLLYYGVANKLLDTEGKAKIDLMDTDPQLVSDNPEINFYLSRTARVLELTQKIKDDWKDEDDVDFGLVNEHLQEVLAQFNNLNITTVAGAKAAARSIANEVDGMLADCETLRTQNQSKARKVDTTIFYVNELIRGVSEIIAGKTIASADLLTIEQINASQAFSSTWTSAGTDGRVTDSHNTSNSRSSDIKSTGFSPATLFDLITHRISATDFFVRVGAGKAENQLGLPENSLYYLVQNFEKAGLHNIDAFYLAIGQAKIEQEFSMPSFYFQGSVLNDKIPDFKKDFDALIKYAGAQIEIAKVAYFWNSPLIEAMTTKDFLKMEKALDPKLFQSFVDTATTAWLEEYVVTWANNGGALLGDIDLEGVAKNVVQRGYNDAIRSAGDDILFRMGISGRLAALEEGAFTSVTDGQALRIDRKLGLKEGSTKALIKKQKVPFGNGANMLEAGEKKQLAEGLYLNTALIDVFLRLINGDITLSQLGRQGLDPGYVDTNPYLKQYGDGGDESNCPITYENSDNKVTWEDFRNRTDLFRQTIFEGNTYCIVDTVGRHCFKNKTDAQAYSVEHKAEQYPDIIDAIANVLDAYVGMTDGWLLTDENEIRERLIAFINGGRNSVFTEEEFGLIEQGEQTLLPTGSQSNLVPLLRKILSKEGDQTPLATYKRAAGHAEATKILNWRLFSSIGIDIPPDLFNPDDLYSILNGDYKPLYRVGAYFLDERMGLKRGTTQLITTALNPKNLKCAIAEASAKMLGDLVGLESVPIRANSPDDLIKNIGEARVEQTLGLPRGIFHGATLDELIANIKPMNFALAFKVPIYTERQENGETLTTISRADIAAILGADKKSIINNSTGTYQLRAIVNHLATAAAISPEASAAVTHIDQTLTEYIKTTLKAYGDGKLPSGTPPENQKDYYHEVEQFKILWNGFDGTFGLDFGITAQLANASITPDEYIKRIGNKMIVLLGAAQIAEALGFTEEAAQVVANTAVNFKKFFVCEHDSGLENVGCEETTYYHNWGMLYENLSVIFKVNLDEKAKLPPGTFARIFADPSQAHWVMLDIAAQRLDEQFQLPRENAFFDSDLLTFSELYGRVYSNVDGRAEERRARDANCTADEKRKANIDTEQIDLAMANNSRVISRGEQSGATDEEKQAAEAARADNQAKAAQKQALNQAIQTCENNWRAALDSRPHQDFWNMVATTTAQWLREGISDSIHNRILEVEVDGERVGIDMPVKDIMKMVFYGDLRYLQIASMALAVNIYQVKNTNEKHPVPANMRITYADLVLAFFPDAASLQVARDAATWAYYNPDGEAFDRSRIPYGYGEICPQDPSVVSAMAHCTPDARGAGLPRDDSSLVNGSSVAISQGYGYDPTTNYTDGAAMLNGIAAERDDAKLKMDQVKNNCTDWDTNYECQAEYSAFEQTYLAKQKEYEDLGAQQRQGERNLRKYNQEVLEYAMVDQMLYGADQNVYRGFSHALFKGNEKVKIAALERYILNGIQNGNLFGIRFDGVRNLVEWQETLAFFTDFSQNNWSNGAAAFNTFVDTGGYRFFTNYLSEKSEDWLGVRLSPEMVGGIICGLSTGTWGNFSPIADESTNVYTSSKGTRIPTLGNAITAWGMQRIFAWADKALGLPIGKSYEWFSMAKQIYSAQKAFIIYKTLSTDSGSITKILGMADTLNKTKEGRAVVDAATKARDAQKALDEARRLGQDITKLQENLDNANKALGDANTALKNAKQLQLIQLEIAIYTKIITFFLDKWLANTYAGIEDKLNLVPGTLAIVVDAAVNLGVTSYVVNNVAMSSANASALTSAAQTGFWIAVAIFIIINLFGVYKIDVSLTCTADGYWPEYDIPTNPNQYDVSSIGTWDGMNPSVMKHKTVETAQYKASRLIGDVLLMQEQEEFKDIVPSQIMTGRQEDVATWNNIVSDYMCKWISTTAQGGICGGNTRAGLWANPQTIAWTHIGY